MNDPIFDPMRKHLRRETLKFAVQTAMFCPRCQGILDVKTAVMLEDSRNGRFVIACAPCSERAPFDGSYSPTIEQYDGRILFGKPKKAKRA